MPLTLNPYATLGVTPNATGEDIRQAYRALVLKWHPDKVNVKSKTHSLAVDAAKQRFQEVQAAYEILADPDRRRQHDDEVFRQRCRTAPQGLGPRRLDPNEMTTANMVDAMQRSFKEEHSDRPSTGRIGTHRLVEDICSLYRDQLEGLADALGVQRRGLQSRDAILTVLLTRLCLGPGYNQSRGSVDGTVMRMQRRAHAWLARERAVQSRARAVNSDLRHTGREYKDLISW